MCVFRPSGITNHRQLQENNFESSQVSYPDEIKFHFFMERREDNVMLETQWALNKLLRVKKVW